MLFQLCRVNNLRGALIVSLQAATDWRSCMRLGIRFSASRGALPSALALTVPDATQRQQSEVCDTAHEAGLVCRVFDDERRALAWIEGSTPRAL